MLCVFHVQYVKANVTLTINMHTNWPMWLFLTPYGECATAYSTKRLHWAYFSVYMVYIFKITLDIIHAYSMNTVLSTRPCAIDKSEWHSLYHLINTHTHIYINKHILHETWAKISYHSGFFVSLHISWIRSASHVHRLTWPQL